METVILDVTTRDAVQTASGLRKSKMIPAIYYGKGEKNISLQMDYQSFRKTYIKTGTSQLIDLKIDGMDTKKVLVHEVQFEPVMGTIHHVDFIHVNLKEKITTEVPIEIVGVAPAVKDLGGVMTHVKDVITVKCLPTAIPHSIELDISGLVEFNASLHVSDLVVAGDVEIVDDLEEVIVIVKAPRVEEEAVVAEGAEVAEGAAPAEGGEAKAEGGESKAEGGEGENKD